MKIEITVGKKFIYFFVSALTLVLVGLYAQPLNIKSVMAQVITPALQNGSKFNDASLPNVLGTTTSVPYQNVNGDVNVSGNLYLANNNNTSTYKLGLSIGDPNHYIYSTGTAGNNTYFGEFNAGFHFKDTAIGKDLINTSVSTVNFGTSAGGNTATLCLNGGCITSWPSSSGSVPGSLSRILAIYSPTQCEQNFTYTLSSGERFPTQIDAAEGINSSLGTSPPNTNVTVGTNNSGTQQVHVWSGIGSCHNVGATFYVLVFGH